MVYFFFNSEGIGVSGSGLETCDVKSREITRIAKSFRNESQCLGRLVAARMYTEMVNGLFCSRQPPE